MELEEILDMRFPHRKMQPSHDISKESINEERKMADLVTKLVENGLNINILLHDSAFKKLNDTIKSVEEDKIAIQREEKRIKTGSMVLNYKEESEFMQSHEDDPFGLEFEHSTSEVRGYEKKGEYNIPWTRDYHQKCSYTIGENGELIAISSLTERTGSKYEKDLSKIGERILTSTKKISVENEQALYSETTHEENYVIGTGVKRINDSKKDWIMNEFDTTLSYTESWRGWVLDLNGNTLEEHKPSRETITRNQDGVTATQCLADGTKKIVLLPSNELFLNYSNDTIINPSEEQIKQAQDELLQKVEHSYGIKDYKNYESIAVVDGKAEKDRFGISYAASEIKLLKTMDKTRELSEKAQQAQQALNEKGVEPLKTDYFDLASDVNASDKSETAEQEPLRADYITDSPAVNDRQKKIGDIKVALQGLIKDGITLEDLQKELDGLGREGNIEEEQNIE